MPSSVNLKALGLNFSSNNLTLPDGSLMEASNVIIRDEDVVESRRGFKLWGESFGTPSDRAKQLINYKSKILRHYQSTLQFQDGVNFDGSVNFTDFSTPISETQTGLRIKSLESSNGNLYFTTSDGIKKLSALTESDITAGAIEPAGGIKALDATGTLDVTLGDQTSFLPQDSAVAYRVVWGKKDLNNNLILGAPSPRTEVYNYLSQLLVRDLNNLLVQLDFLNQGTSLITDGNYFSSLSLPISATGTETRLNLIALEQKLDNDIYLANSSGVGVPLTISSVTDQGSDVYRVNFSAGDATDFVEVGGKIQLTGFTTTTGDIDGPQTISVVDPLGTYLEFTNPTAATGNASVLGDVYSYEYGAIAEPAIIVEPAVNAQLETLQVYLEAIIDRLKSELDGVIPTAVNTTYISPLLVTTTASVTLTITVPEDVTPSHFLQIYRSPIATADGGVVLGVDIFPSDELKLIYEAFPTESELEALEVVVHDETPDEFAGANLYTNGSTGEGILQANEPPPFAKDINSFKGSTFYANTRTHHKKNFSLLGVSSMITDYNNLITPSVIIADSSSSNTYTFVVGSAESRTLTTDTFANTTDTGWFSLYSANNTKKYYVWMDKTGSSVDPAPSGFDEGIRVNISLDTTDAQIANRIREVIGNYPSVFVCTLPAANQVLITNVDEGYADNSAITNLSNAWAIAQTQEGVGELVAQQSSSILFPAGAAFTNVGASDYFTVSDAFNRNRYALWFQVGASVAPVVAGYDLVEVPILVGDTNAQIAQKAKNALDDLDIYTTSIATATVTITYTTFGPGDAVSIGTIPPPGAVTLLQTGALQVLLSNVTSPSQAVDLTARSFVRIINKNRTELVYAYYLSGTQDVPGKFLLERRDLSSVPFYMVGNNASTGNSFSPPIAPTNTISNISVGSPTTITSAAHGLTNQDQILITGSLTTPNIDGLYSISNATTNTFTIPVEVFVAGTVGAFVKVLDAEVSENDDLPNRVYYSKLNQPEAVPILNFYDVGAKNKAILRIYPLRDSLFVFKEDGLFRVSGEGAPFNLGLFDSSCILLAPDSVDTSNNNIYGWTTQGIATVNESGFDVKSRPIDNVTLKTQTFPSFKTATWGLGYESDNSYTVWTVYKSADTSATIGYRFSNLTNTWTTVDKQNTCGIINSFDDKMVMGAGDVNYLEQERKDFSRTDYADREIVKTLAPNNYFEDRLGFKLSSVSDISIGDVIVQSQTLSVYTLNMLMEKLDFDVGVGSVPISSISTGANPLIATSSPHNLVVGDYVTISSTNCVPQIQGTFEVLTVPTASSFTIAATYAVSVAGTSGVSKLSYADTYISVAGDNLKSNLLSITTKMDTDPGLATTTFNSTISAKSGVITSIDPTNPTVITSAGHGLISGRVIEISSSVGGTPVINGTFPVTVLSSNTFSIPVSVITSGVGGNWNTVESSFEDLKACFNKVIDLLNNDTGATLLNYDEITDNTDLETVVVAIDNNSKEVTVNNVLDFIIGDLVIYKAIPSTFTYSPSTFGDALAWKHVREATVMFASKAFTTATISFASDMLPAFIDTTFRGEGSGIFGQDNFGESFFGGTSNSAPFRTYIPRDCQRCRFIRVKYSHQVAREKYEVYGISLTGEAYAIPERAYRS